MKRSLYWLVLLLGCDTQDTQDDFNCSNDGLSGLASVEMDGDRWAADSGQWNRAGSGIQINLTFDGPQRSMTVRGTRDAYGVNLSERIEEGSFPINVSLSGEDGTGSIIDLGRNQSYASNEASGNLTILDVQGDTLSACFSFIAVSDDSTMIEVTNGMAEVGEM